MTRYEFHCDSNVLELQRDDARVFIDLSDLELIEREDDSGLNSMRVYTEADDVHELFGYYGCAEKCPVGDMPSEG